MSAERTYTLTVGERLANELRQWAEDSRRDWPDGTAFQDDLASLLRQLTPEGRAHVITARTWAAAHAAALEAVEEHRALGLLFRRARTMHLAGGSVQISLWFTEVEDD